MGLHPLTTLIAIYMGLMLLGFWGLLLGPALVIGYKAFVDERPVIPPHGAGKG
jgi:predicted PurR-regulated permease PerM